MKTEPTFQQLSADDIVKALIADDPDLQAFESDLLDTITQMKTGDYAKWQATKIPVSTIAETRNAVQLSQPKFAEKLGISVATLRSWEQGLRKPSGAAKTLLELLHRRPDLIDELQV